MTTFRSYRTVGLAAALLGGLWAAQALSQDDAMEGHDMSTMGGGAMTPATEGYMAANAAMMRDMEMEFTGDADVDYARGMIVHHEGAIAMSRVVLEHGSDPEIRGLAEEIIAAQEEEIAFLNGWLEANAE